MLINKYLLAGMLLLLSAAGAQAVTVEADESGPEHLEMAWFDNPFQILNNAMQVAGVGGVLPLPKVAVTPTITIAPTAPPVAIPVPEPATLSLFALGLAGIGLSRRKKSVSPKAVLVNFEN